MVAEIIEYHVLLRWVLACYSILSGIRPLTYGNRVRPWPEVLLAWLFIFGLTGLFFLPYFTENGFIPSLLAFVIPGLAIASYDLFSYENLRQQNVTYLWIKLTFGFLLAISTMIV